MSTTPAPMPDFKALLRYPSLPGPLGRIGRSLRKIAAVRNWNEFTAPSRSKYSADAAPLCVKFRNGFEIMVRPQTHDLYIVYEVYLEGGYRALETILQTSTTPVTVLDLGAHIGCFSLRALRAGRHVHVESYEPGSDNRALLRKNLEHNHFGEDRVQVYDAAVAGADGTATFYHEPTITVDSSLYGSGEGAEVPVVSLSTVLARCKYPIGILKVDIEGAEYDLIDSTAKDVWESIPVIMAEVHADPAGKKQGEDWLRRMYELGYTRQTSDLNGVLLQRP